MFVDYVKHIRKAEKQLRVKLTAIQPVFGPSSNFFYELKRPPPPFPTPSLAFKSWDPLACLQVHRFQVVVVPSVVFRPPKKGNWDCNQFQPTPKNTRTTMGLMRTSGDLLLSLVGLCIVSPTTTNDDIGCLLFGCHIADSDMAPGFRVRQGNGGEYLCRLTWIGTEEDLRQ
jgi:hypothetical protein